MKKDKRWKCSSLHKNKQYVILYASENWIEIKIKQC